MGIALVTGGASGIGRATSELLAERGDHVVIADLSDATEAVQSIRAAGGSAESVMTDVSDPADVDRLMTHIRSTHGRLDAALNAAGYEGPIGAFTERTVDEMNRVLAINVLGTMLCMQGEIALMSGGGSIVNIGSVAGIRGMKRLSLYSAAKHGVIGLTRAVALEQAARGIRINAVCPGGIDTPMLAKLARYADPDRSPEEVLGGAHPMRRLGQPREVATVIATLLSPEAGFITGTAIPVDGGVTAQ
ncbi:SDR family NAD(P)-dependent oxidoreductase [Mesobacterium pallidum]|uniref:SDR family NAD(P)-dependent oxidoreductase n=1 Tax=Mesobacterium pallidum TaxID=2872037 RepID=UPI001EE2A4F8|nr:SDR family oxidoreductase [Mesobacterium pallidum]